MLRRLGGSGRVAAGRLGELAMRPEEIVLGVPLRIDKSNMDGLDFSGGVHGG